MAIRPKLRPSPLSLERPIRWPSRVEFEIREDAKRLLSHGFGRHVFTECWLSIVINSQFFFFFLLIILIFIEQILLYMIFIVILLVVLCNI